MKICALSDLHGVKLPKIKECDVVCICGDIVDLKAQAYLELSKRWFKNIFTTWLNKIPCKLVLLVGGNHDFYLEYLYRSYDKNKGIKYLNKPVVLLDNESYEFEGVSFFGTPFCKPFGRWAYMRNEEESNKLFAEIPYNLDVLLTHDAPYMVSDVCDNTNYIIGCTGTPSCEEDLHWGNMALYKAVKEKQPKYLFHGHLHSSNHNEELLGNTKVYNVSILDDYYNPFYVPLYIEI